MGSIPTVDHKSVKASTEFKKGECFKCRDKWSPGHQCKSRTLHQSEGEYTKEGQIEEGETATNSFM